MFQGKKENTRLYQPLPILGRPSYSIIIDLFFGLPQKKRGNDFIFVVMDNNSKMAHFIPCTKTTDVDGVANLYFEEVVKLHCFPRTIAFY